MKMLAIKMENQTSQPTFSHALNLCHYYHKNSHSPINQLLNFNFFLHLVFSYTIHVPLHPYLLKYHRNWTPIKLESKKLMAPANPSFLYFTAEFLEFSFNPRCKIGWPLGHLDRVCDISLFSL